MRVTFGEDFRDFCMAGTESTVNFEAVCIVKEGATKGEQHFLWSKRKKKYYNTGGLKKWSYLQTIDI